MVPQFEKIVHEIKLPLSSLESQTNFEIIIAGNKEEMTKTRFIRGKIEIETFEKSRDHTELKVMNDVNITNSSFVIGLSRDAVFGKMSFMQ